MAESKATPVPVREPDYLTMACTAANVSYKGSLDPDMLVKTLLTGNVLAGFAPYLRVVFDELPLSVFNGLVQQICSQSTDPDTVRQHVREVGEAIHSSRLNQALGLAPAEVALTE